MQSPNYDTTHLPLMFSPFPEKPEFHNSVWSLEADQMSREDVGWWALIFGKWLFCSALMLQIEAWCDRGVVLPHQGMYSNSPFIAMGAKKASSKHANPSQQDHVAPGEDEHTVVI